jgi:pimeloyl-ACP methyl ester carboxylesterase
MVQAMQQNRHCRLSDKAHQGAYTRRNRLIGLGAVAVASGLAIVTVTRRRRELSGFVNEVGDRKYLSAYDDVLRLWPVWYEELDVTTPYGNTHIIASGPESGPPLLLLHATGTSSTGWLLNIGELSRTYRVYAVDIIGEAGKSRQSQLLRDRADCVAWLSAVLDGLGIYRTCLAGWSFGGWLSLNFVLALPERVKRAVLLAPFASLAAYKPAVLMFLKAGPYLPMGPPGRLALRMFSPDFEFNPAFARQFALGGKYHRAPDPRRSVFPAPYSDEELRSVAVPTLVLVGDREQTFDPHRALASARRLIPDVQTGLLPGAGHFLAMDNALAVNERMLQFLNS